MQKKDNIRRRKDKRNSTKQMPHTETAGSAEAKSLEHSFHHLLVRCRESIDFQRFEKDSPHMFQ
jgi:hypothetical protein